MSNSNRIKSELAQGNAVCGCMVTEVRTPAISMILESAGLDFFIIDMEHGSFNFESVNDIILSCRGLRIAPFVRVPAIAREAFQKPLDSGALGLLVPRVESPEEVERCLELMRYAPAGSRGLSLRRAHSGFTKQDAFRFTSIANENVMLMVQIESRKGVESIDAISDVPGIDVLFIGPSDLSHSYGEGSTILVSQAIERVVETGNRKGIATGIHHSDLEVITDLLGRGMRFISCNTEVGAIINVFSKMEEAIRSTAGLKRSV
jgi:2-keto-3-deoxy-L-rhamnonate aldolase RhmA